MRRGGLKSFRKTQRGEQTMKTKTNLMQWIIAKPRFLPQRKFTHTKSLSPQPEKLFSTPCSFFTRETNPRFRKVRYLCGGPFNTQRAIDTVKSATNGKVSHAR